MGRPDKITPDVVEWVVADDRVTQKWKSLAARLGLEAYVPKIDENYSYRRKKFDRQKMKELFEVWRRASPITFTRSRLMDVLGKEGLTDMYSWLQLMETEADPRKNEISMMLDTPRSAKSLSPQPTYNSLLGAPPHSAPLGYNGSLPSSPYSWYFGQNGQNHKDESDANSTYSSTAPSAGILKKTRNPSANGASSYSSCYSDYGSVGGNGGVVKNGGRCSTDSAATTASRESTPDSLTRAITRVDVQVHATPSSSTTSHQTTTNGKMSTPKSGKTLRFADDLVSSSARSSSGDSVDAWLKRNGTNGGHSTASAITVGKRRSASEDRSVERYFDNLITMIEDAAEGL